MPASDEQLDQLIEASGRILALPLEPDWKPSIKANLAVSFRLAALVEAFALPDEAEPAPIFEA
jgi:hypothetical protein